MSSSQKYDTGAAEGLLCLPCHNKNNNNNYSNTNNIILSNRISTNIV